LRSVSLKGIAPKEKIRTGPGQLRPEFWLLGVDAEPHSGGRVPGVDVSAFRCLCEVRLEGAGVVGVGVDVDFDAGAGCDADGGLAWAELVAADVAAGDGADEAVVLPVLGLSDCGPLCAAVDDGQSVCEVSVKAVRKMRERLQWALATDAAARRTTVFFISIMVVKVMTWRESCTR
jgi:hypothetical protein